MDYTILETKLKEKWIPKGFHVCMFEESPMEIKIYEDCINYQDSLMFHITFKNSRNIFIDVYYGTFDRPYSYLRHVDPIFVKQFYNALYYVDNNKIELLIDTVEVIKEYYDENNARASGHL